MNTALKTTLALGVAGLSLLTLAGTAGAQTQVGDPNLTTVFSTFNGKGQPGFSATSIGLGYDANQGGGKLAFSTTQATAQSVYEAFNFTSSAAGAFSTLAAGSAVQIEAYALNDNIHNDPSTGLIEPFDVYATLYAYNPNAAAGTVPVTGPDLFSAPQKITIGAIQGGYFSSDFTTTAALVAGQSYVFGFTTLNNDTQDFALMGATTGAQNGLTSADLAFAKNKYITDDDDQGAPIVSALDQNNATTLAFKLDAGPAPVPEASSLVSTAILLSLGAAFLAFKRRRSFVK